MKLKRLGLFLFVVMAAGLLVGCHKHDYEPASCTSGPRCRICGETDGMPNGHRFKDATCTEPRTCSVCGQTDGAAKGHSFIEATCQAPKTCSVCGATEGSAIEHDFAEATCTEPKTCVNCGETKGKPTGHKYGKESCTEDVKCSVCGEVKKAVGHLYNPATCQAPKTCNVCGETEGAPLEHDFVDGICKKCGAENGSLAEIKKVCGLVADVQKDASICVVNVNTDHNPYDVTYDYGPEYQAMVDRCDWSLVFDAAYYKKAFPVLARLYHNDDALLLEHYQTVGIHEGRQACEAFCPHAYYYNCDVSIYKAFEKNYEGYIFYYMLHYDEEKNVNTKTVEDKKIRKQIKRVLTAVQSEELKGINKYREDAGADDVTYDSELQALANYRAYINSKDNWDAHDWAIDRRSELDKFFDLFTKEGVKYGENNVTYDRSSAKTFRGDVNCKKYFDSPEHYDCMVNPRYKYVGVSNCYIGENNKTNTYKKSGSYEGSQFDVYLSNLSTATNP